MALGADWLLIFWRSIASRISPTCRAPMTTLSRYWLFAVAATLSVAVASPSFAEKRVALVVGNSAYQNTQMLANPVNDAEDMAAALKAVGFNVIMERNLTKRGMESAIA